MPHGRTRVTSPPTGRRLSIRPPSRQALLQLHVLRRKSESIRSLQGRVTIATPVPEHWTSYVAWRQTNHEGGERDAHRTPLEYCIAGARLQGFLRSKRGCKRGAFGISCPAKRFSVVSDQAFLPDPFEPLIRGGIAHMESGLSSPKSQTVALILRNFPRAPHMSFGRIQATIPAETPRSHAANSSYTSR